MLAGMEFDAKSPRAGRARIKASDNPLGLADRANAGIACSDNSTETTSEATSQTSALPSDPHSAVGIHGQKKTKPRNPTTTARLGTKTFSIVVKSTGIPPTCSLDFVARLLFSRAHTHRKSRSSND